MCALDGTLEIKLVPHVYRQEMMPSDTTEYHHEGKGVDMIVELEVNESPVNLFSEEMHRDFPTTQHIEKHYSETLNRGDCIYIPSFYFYQLHGESTIQPK